MLWHTHVAIDAAAAIALPAQVSTKRQSLQQVLARLQH